MGRDVQVKIGKRTFGSKKEAEQYFLHPQGDIREYSCITRGRFFNELKAFYTLYCNSDPGWTLNGRLLVHFIAKPEKHLRSGKWITMFCYEVYLSNGEFRRFSIPGAIDAIIKASSKSVP